MTSDATERHAPEEERTMLRRVAPVAAAEPIVHLLDVEAAEGEPARRVAIGPGPLTIGRGAQAGLVLPSGDVSRSHCVIALEGEVAIVTDRSARPRPGLGGASALRSSRGRAGLRASSPKRPARPRGGFCGASAPRSARAGGRAASPIRSARPRGGRRDSSVSYSARPRAGLRGGSSPPRSGRGAGPRWVGKAAGRAGLRPSGRFGGRRMARILTSGVRDASITAGRPPSVDR